MIGYGVVVDDFGPVVEILDFIEIGEVLGGQKFLSEGEKNGVSLLDDEICKVEVSWTGEAGLGSERGLTVEELYPFLAHFYN